MIAGSTCITRIGGAIAPPLFVGFCLTAQDMDPGPLLTRARAARLAEDRGWRTLLHIPTGSTRSQMADPRFFLSDSRTPEAELEATLRALLQDPNMGERFPARAAWLAEHLEGLPRRTSPDFERAWALVNPRKAVLVFADAYMASPASMFGHTLLTLRASRGTAHLDQAVNYAAITQESNGLVFAVKGIFGRYPGSYSLLPYHQKIQEYAATEHRDLWEYDLQLSPAQLRRLGEHLWELRGLGAPYYFFDRNCSYQLLHLLQAAVPERDLFRPLPPWVVPLDTVRALQDAGLLAPARRRLSLANEVRLAAAPLSDGDQALARTLGEGGTLSNLMGLPAPRQAAVLDLAAAWLQAQRALDHIEQEAYQPRLRGLLTARARTGAVPAQAQPPTPPAPDQGHPSTRMRLSFTQAGEARILDLAWRPALHDWMDPQAGYAPGSEISFLDLSLRLREGRTQPTLGPSTLVRVRAFRPWDAFFHPLTWTGGLQIREEETAVGPRRHIVGDLGAGATFGTRTASLYGLALGEARGLRAQDQETTLRLGIGAEAGALLDWTDTLRVRAYARLLHRPVDRFTRDLAWGVEARWHLRRRGSIGLDTARREAFGLTQHTVTTSVAIFF